MARLVLETDLPAGECFRRILEHTDSWALLGWGATDSYLAKVRPPRFKLASPSFGGNPMRGVFYGRVVAEAGRTRIYGRLGVALPWLLFFSLFFALAAALNLPVLSSVPGLQYIELRFATCWVVILALLRVFGAWDYGGPEDKYSAFLASILQAQESVVGSWSRR